MTFSCILSLCSLFFADCNVSCRLMPLTLLAPIDPPASPGATCWNLQPRSDRLLCSSLGRPSPFGLFRTSDTMSLRVPIQCISVLSPPNKLLRPSYKSLSRLRHQTESSPFNEGSGEGLIARGGAMQIFETGNICE